MKPPFDNPTEREQFYALAARIFEVSREELTAETAYQSIPGWDSVNHLRLVMEAEKAFGIEYALETIPFLKRLGDFLV